MSFDHAAIEKLNNRTLAIGAAAMLSLMFATSAQAKYTAIDSSGTKALILNFGGYCDASVGDFGDECDSPNQYLPYEADIGGSATNKLIVRNDGVIQFVGNYIGNADPINQFKVLAQVDAGNPGDVFPPEIAAFKMVGNNFVVTFFQCITPQHCYSGKYAMILAPVYRAGDEGFDVKFKYASDSGVDDADKKKNYFFGAIFDSPVAADAVPEPGAWALMILGFGGVGAALRRGPRRRPQAT